MPKRDNRLELGRKGERIAERILISKGFQIIRRNYRYGRFEVDLIAEDENLIVFVEVKTRSTKAFGNPEDFLSASQQKRLIEAANAFSFDYKPLKNIRFDIFSIVLTSNNEEVLHLEDAFWSSP